MMELLKIFIIYNLLQPNQAIIGFDWDSTDPTVTTYFHVDNGDCNFHEEDLTITKTAANCFSRMLSQREMINYIK